MEKKLKQFAVGSKVQWKWLGRAILGSVEEIHHKPIAKVIKGKSIKRNGSKENPAYLVKSQAGNLALKLQSELHASGEKKSNRAQPKMFSV